MIHKILLNKTIYVLPAVFLILVGQFLYFDAKSRVSTDITQTYVTEDITEPKDSLLALVPTSNDEVFQSQIAGPVGASVFFNKDMGEETPNVVETPQTIAEETTYEENILEDYVEETIDETVTETINETSDTEESLPTVKLPYMESIFTEESFWTLGYGVSYFEDGRIKLGGDGMNNASLIYLDGGFELKDYTFSTTFDWYKSASVDFIARFADYDNFVACSFVNQGARVSIVSYSDGERFSHNSSPSLKIKTFETWKDVNLGIKVSGNTVECLSGGEVVLKNTLSKIPEKGTVGISIWAPHYGESFVSIKEVLVK